MIQITVAHAAPWLNYGNCGRLEPFSGRGITVMKSRNRLVKDD